MGPVHRSVRWPGRRLPVPGLWVVLVELNTFTTFLGGMFQPGRDRRGQDRDRG